MFARVDAPPRDPTAPSVAAGVKAAVCEHDHSERKELPLGAMIVLDSGSLHMYSSSNQRLSFFVRIHRPQETRVRACTGESPHNAYGISYKAKIMGYRYVLFPENSKTNHEHMCTRSDCLPILPKHTIQHFPFPPRPFSKLRTSFASRMLFVLHKIIVQSVQNMKKGVSKL